MPIDRAPPLLPASAESHPLFDLPDAIRDFFSPPEYRDYARAYEQDQSEEAAAAVDSVQQRMSLPPGGTGGVVCAPPPLHHSPHYYPFPPNSIGGYYVIYGYTPARYDPTTGLVASCLTSPIPAGAQLMYVPPSEGAANHGMMTGLQQFSQTIEQLHQLQTMKSDSQTTIGNEEQVEQGREWMRESNDERQDGKERKLLVKKKEKEEEEEEEAMTEFTINTHSEYSENGADSEMSGWDELSPSRFPSFTTSSSLSFFTPFPDGIDGVSIAMPTSSSQSSSSSGLTDGIRLPPSIASTSCATTPSEDAKETKKEEQPEEEGEEAQPGPAVDATVERAIKQEPVDPDELVKNEAIRHQRPARRVAQKRRSEEMNGRSNEENEELAKKLKQDIMKFYVKYVVMACAGDPEELERRDRMVMECVERTLGQRNIKKEVKEEVKEEVEGGEGEEAAVIVPNAEVKREIKEEIEE